MICQGFQPIEPAFMRVLILGSMPGVASLTQQAYYAHPRNGFWPITSKLCNQAWSLDWNERYRQLMDNNIGLWDVLAECNRTGSLDSAIQPSGLQVNDIAQLINAHPECRVIALNGAKASELFNRYVLKSNPVAFNGINILLLPSSSPAHARLNLADKTKIWQDKLANFL